MQNNIKLLHLAKQKQAVNDYVGALLGNQEYQAFTYAALYAWIEQLQRKLDSNEPVDAPKDLLKAAKRLSSYKDRVRDFCSNMHFDYEDTLEKLDMWYEQAQYLAIS